LVNDGSDAANLDTPEEYENENLENLPKDQLTFDNLGYHFVGQPCGRGTFWNTRYNWVKQRTMWYCYKYFVSMPCDQGKHWRRTYSKKDQTYWWKCTENNGYLMGDDSTETPALNSQETGDNITPQTSNDDINALELGCMCGWNYVTRRCNACSSGHHGEGGVRPRTPPPPPKPFCTPGCRPRLSNLDGNGEESLDTTESPEGVAEMLFSCRCGWNMKAQRCNNCAMYKFKSAYSTYGKGPRGNGLDSSAEASLDTSASPEAVADNLSACRCGYNM
jgi:hypothetical protein